MKTILVDAWNTFFTEEWINDEMRSFLDSLENPKIILTNANEEQMKEFWIDKSPYKIFTLNHNPNKNEEGYYTNMLEKLNLIADECIYFEHNEEAVIKAKEVGITTLLYKNDVNVVKKFILENM